MGSQERSAVVVEVLAFRVTAAGGLAYRRLTGSLGSGSHPDEVARELLGLPRRTRDHLLHSTSWRHEPSGSVVLTYACVPDPRPDLPATPLATRTIAHADAPASPSPADLEIEHIAAHAVRHLAFLEHTDPVAHPVIASVPGLSHALAHWPPAAAGQLQDTALGA